MRTRSLPVAFLVLCGLLGGADSILAQEQKPPADQAVATNKLSADQLLNLLEQLVGNDHLKRQEAAAAIGSAPNLQELAQNPAVIAAAGIKIVVEETFEKGADAWKLTKGGEPAPQIEWSKDGGCIHWTRAGSDGEGGNASAAHTLTEEVAGCDHLILGARVKVEDHSLKNSGWVSDLRGGYGEYPVHLMLGYLDAKEKPFFWTHGFLTAHDGRTRRKNYSIVRPNEWCWYGVNIMDPSSLETPDPERPEDACGPPAVVRDLTIAGQGWDFAGAVDEIRLVQITAVNEKLKRKDLPAEEIPVEEIAFPPPPSPETPRNYAIVMSGSSGDARHAGWFKNSTGMLFRVLTECYGCSPEAVYYLYESPEESPETIDGKATLENFKRIMAGLAKMMRSQDRLLVYMIGHGQCTGGHSEYDFVGRDMKDTELATMLDALPTVNIVVVMSPCQMGKFVDRCSKKGRVIISSTRPDEGNRAGFAEYFILALEKHLNDTNGDGKTSMKEAYDHTVGEVVRYYENEKIPEIQEHALLDDNGDGVGHYGKGIVEGDGEFADKVFVGNEGIKIEPDEKYESWLKECNKALLRGVR